MTSTRRQLALWRSVAALCTFGALGASGLAVATATGVGAAAEPIVIKGAGTELMNRQIVEWQNTMLGAPSPVDLAYTAKGARDARQLMLEGKEDLIITGLPFTTQELASRPAGSTPYIEAPVHVATAMILLTPPFLGNGDGLESFKQICDFDAEEVREECVEIKPIPKPVRIPPENLAGMMLSVSKDDLKYWSNPKLLEQWDVEQLTFQRGLGPKWMHRSEGSAMNFYLQKYAQTAAPRVWELAKTEFPNVKWEPVDEVIPLASKKSRQGLEAQVGTIANWRNGDGASTDYGSLGGVPPSALELARELYPNTPYYPVEIKNGADEWIAPTPASINAAVDAGGDTPLYALTNPVPGAYPLVWINQMYVPSSGLSLEKTNAIATWIRYLATDGQDLAAAHGEGRLSAALVTEALAAADEVVVKNCTKPEQEVVTSTNPGSNAPATPKLQAIGNSKLCALKPPPATTTTIEATTTTTPPTTAAAATTSTVAATTTPPTTAAAIPVTQAPVVQRQATPSAASPPAAAPPAVFPSPNVDQADTTVPGETVPETTLAEPAQPTTTSPIAALAPSAGPPPKAAIARPSILSRLPFDLPGGGPRRLDRLATLLMGALIFMGGRKLARGKIAGIRLSSPLRMSPA
jgi:hypothetical protein